MSKARWGLLVVVAGLLIAVPIVLNAAAEKEKENKEEASAPAHGGWTEDAEAAVRMSQETGKPILANFTGSDWCAWCMKLEEEVFSTEEFKAWADENVVLLTLDFPRKAQSPEIKEQNEALKKKYEEYVPGFPTILFLNGQGEVLGKSGYREGGPQAWVEHAQGIVDKSKSEKEST